MRLIVIRKSDWSSLSELHCAFFWSANSSICTFSQMLHRYLDRLAALYLLKLNLGDSFATRAGSCWRLLYALTLMPWLRKYRADARKDDGKTVHQRDHRPDTTPAKASRRESILEGEVARLRAETLQLQNEMKNMGLHPTVGGNLARREDGSSRVDDGKGREIGGDGVTEEERQAGADKVAPVAEQKEDQDGSRVAV